MGVSATMCVAAEDCPSRPATTQRPWQAGNAAAQGGSFFLGTPAPLGPPSMQPPQDAAVHATPYAVTPD